MDYTVSEKIIELETRLISLTGKIDKQEHLEEVEEGGSSSRFRSKFVDVEKLYLERDKLTVRLRTLRTSL